MSMGKVGAVQAPSMTPAPGRGAEPFASHLQELGRHVVPPREGGRGPAPVQEGGRVEGTLHRAPVQGSAVHRAPGVAAGTAAPRAWMAVQVVGQVAQAQRRLDHVLQLAQSGKAFTPAELLALQAHVYRASEELELAGKVVDKATGGVKQVLQTQV